MEDILCDYDECVKTKEGYVCSLCNKNFMLKENYQKHYVGCKMYHRLAFQTNDEFMEELETIPSPKIMYRMFLEMALRCSLLEKEVQQLRCMVNTKNKKQIVDVLKKVQVKTSFEEWYLKFTVTRDMLHDVLSGGLIVGVKQVLDKECKSGDKNIPIKAFTKKSGMFYVYSKKDNADEYGWKLALNEDFHKMITFIQRLFGKEFLAWQKENIEVIAHDEKMKDQEFAYILQISGPKTQGEKIVADIKKWLFHEIEQDIESFEFV